jgi:hypothetical protein
LFLLSPHNIISVQNSFQVQKANCVPENGPGDSGRLIRHRRSPLDLLGTQQFPADQVPENTAAEALGQLCVFRPRDLMEERLVHKSLGHQDKQMRMEIDPVPDVLESGNIPGGQHAPGHDLEEAAWGGRLFAFILCKGDL